MGTGRGTGTERKLGRIVALAAVFVLGAVAAGLALVLRDAGAERERTSVDADAGVGAEQSDVDAFAPGARSVERAPVDVEEPRARVEELDVVLERLARCERDFLRSQESAAARSAVEDVVGALVARSDVLAHIGARRAEVGSRSADVAEIERERLQLLRYGSVRAFYWVVQQRSGPQPANASDAEVERAHEHAVRAVLEAIDQVATLELETATFLTDTLVVLFEGDGVVRPDALLERLLERRLRFPERAGLYDRILLAYAQRLDEDTRLALSRWLLADPSDVTAVTSGLEGLFACGRAALALELARDGFEGADEAGRLAIAEAVALSAPPDDAAAFLLERAEQTMAAAAAWMALGSRPDGGLEALEVAYQGLRAVGENPVGRRLAVMAMDAAEPLELRWIATDDPDPAVQGQAILTLSTRSGPPADGDVDALVDVLERAGPGTFAFAACAADNVLHRAKGQNGAAQRERVVAALQATVLDETSTALVAGQALDVLEGWVTPAEYAWLEAALEQR